MAKAVTNAVGELMSTAAQVSPDFVDLKRPLYVPARIVEGADGSIAREMTPDPALSRPVLSSAHVVPESVDLKTLLATVPA